MNTYILKNIGARTIKFDDNTSNYYAQVKMILGFRHAHCRLGKLIKIELQA